MVQDAKKRPKIKIFSVIFFSSHSMEVSNRDRTVVKSVTAKVYLYPLDEIQISRHQPETLFKPVKWEVASTLISHSS